MRACTSPPSSSSCRYEHTRQFCKDRHCLQTQTHERTRGDRQTQSSSPSFSRRRRRRKLQLVWLHTILPRARSRPASYRGSDRCPSRREPVQEKDLRGHCSVLAHALVAWRRDAGLSGGRIGKSSPSLFLQHAALCGRASCCARVGGRWVRCLLSEWSEEHIHLAACWISAPFHFSYPLPVCARPGPAAAARRRASACGQPEYDLGATGLHGKGRPVADQSAGRRLSSLGCGRESGHWS